ncbi:GIY-YIG nuclease family protein [Candidatus Gracilibacteria bacterium]|nr:GIY-YIG nuclease family protein [Candidatus Gracilibacteria bacterium]
MLHIFSENIQNILRTLPSSPGIYQFFDNKGEIIYVGKSVNLKSRVNSYFNGKSKLNFAKQKMVGKIADIQYIVVNNETESLILESNLIKKHKPKYNVLLKDDKNHLYIKITKAEFPKIIKTRIGPNAQKKDGEYFGPYLNGNYVNFILTFIKKYFGYGVGEHNFFVSKKSYNLDKYLFNTPIQNPSSNQPSLLSSLPPRGREEDNDSNRSPPPSLSPSPLQRGKK